MLRTTLARLHSSRSGPLPQHRDTSKSPKLMSEVGAWLYKKETMTTFQQWCRERQVRAYGNVKMASNPQFARCLRVNDSTRRFKGTPSPSAAGGGLGGVGGASGPRAVIEPGQAIITVPASACFNFLTVAREMSETADSVFPIQLNWMNYNQRVEFLKSAAQFEVAQAGWMVRIASFASLDDGEDSISNSREGQQAPHDNSNPAIKRMKFLNESGSVNFYPFINYLLEDTRGRDGVAQGISREREEDSGLLDHYFSEMATDCCEDPEVFLERMFISLAAVFHRSQPIEADAIDYFMRGGVNFFKAKKAEMFVPTLIPLMDCIPQREDGDHNTTVEFFPYSNEETLKRQLTELKVPFYEKGNPKPTVERVNSDGSVEHIVNTEHELMDTDLLRHGGGFFALRALRPLEEGDVLYVRKYPWLGGDVGEQQRNAQVAEAGRILSYDA